MFRKILNTVIESTLQIQPESIAYPSPFTKADTIHLNWLTSFAPCFPVNSKHISILTEPQQFYNTLLQKCNEAKDRITLVSLYLGNGAFEKNLVDAMLSNERFKTGNLKINVLLDYSRGSRNKDNSRLVLKPLLESNDKICNVSLYHTPVLRGLKKKYAPGRVNELLGIQHMKLYIFDDTLVISGANLSNDYFTNRQDRYYIIKDKQLCDFYCGLVNRVQSFSLKMDKENNVSLNEGWAQLPYEGRKSDFVQKAGDSVENYLLDARDEQNLHKQEGFDTWVFPLIQMGQLGIENDETVTTRLISDAPLGAKLCMATSYFNLTNQYMNTIISDSVADCHLLMAHPNANGFKGAKGLAGGIPDAYSLIMQRFKQKSDDFSQSNRITLKEYLREGWTYHGKGLWYYPPGDDLPCLSLVGSPNFGERSINLDLETQIAVVTENLELRKQMNEECKKLYELGLPADTSRTIPNWVYLFVFLFRGYF